MLTTPRRHPRPGDVGIVLPAAVPSFDADQFRADLTPFKKKVSGGK
jgi:hypothetical protein